MTPPDFVESSETFACTPADLCEVGDEGHLGLLVYLIEYRGWRVYGQRRPTGVALFAESDSYSLGKAGATDAVAAKALFGELVSDEPDALAAGADFWPLPEPPVSLEAWRHRA